MGVIKIGDRLLFRLLKNRRGTAEIVGSILFLVILLFFFTNVYLWHDQATRRMDNVVVDKMNSPIEVAFDGVDTINVTNKGGVGVALSRLWINKENGDHVYAELENIQDSGGLWLSGGATIELKLNPSASGPYVSPVAVNWVDQVAVVQYAPIEGDVFKVLTTLGNIAACTYSVPESPP